MSIGDRSAASARPQHRSRLARQVSEGHAGPVPTLGCFVEVPDQAPATTQGDIRGREMPSGRWVANPCDAWLRRDVQHHPQPLSVAEKWLRPVRWCRHCGKTAPIRVGKRYGAHEVDVVAEIGEATIGIEVNASSAPTADAARHLAWLRDLLGDTFVAGVVLHTGAGNVRPGREAGRCPDLHAVVVTLTGLRTSPRARHSV